MVIVKIKGGLGNQMFQYAFGIALSKKLETDLFLDVQSYKKYREHKYQLHHLSIKETIANKQDIDQFFPKGIKKYFLKKKNFHLIKENGMAFQKYDFVSTDHYYIKGYRQSEKYFNMYKQDILNHFAVRSAMNETNSTFFKKIVDSNSVSLHVRRGDYITHEDAYKILGVCSLEYYEKAIKHIENQVENPTFFIFSDDLDWAKDNIKVNNKIYFVNANDKDSGYEDMRLMSYCKHNIIANSTFSWWGAWLNQNENKIVIAPSRWFNDANKSSIDIIPDHWIKI